MQVKKSDNYFYSHVCLLKKDFMPLRWISIDGIYNLEKAPIPKKIKELFLGERCQSGKEVSPHQCKELPKNWTVVTAEGVIKTSLSTIQVDEDDRSVPTYRYIM